jgi:hypothetical protein
MPSTCPVGLTASANLSVVVPVPQPIASTASPSWGATAANAASVTSAISRSIRVCSVTQRRVASLFQNARCAWQWFDNRSWPAVSHIRQTERQGWQGQPGVAAASRHADGRLAATWEPPVDDPLQVHALHPLLTDWMPGQKNV